MEFHVKISFLHKESITKKIIMDDGFSAILKALNDLNWVDKDNIKGVNITHIN